MLRAIQWLICALSGKGSLVSNQEILEKAITQAIAGGWKVHTYRPIDFEVREDLVSLLEVSELVEIITEEEIVSEPTNTYAYSKNDLLFNKQFARALWGEGENRSLGGSGYGWERYPLWKSNLEHMVTANDPIQYLGEHLTGVNEQ